MPYKVMQLKSLRMMPKQAKSTRKRQQMRQKGRPRSHKASQTCQRPPDMMPGGKSTDLHYVCFFFCVAGGIGPSIRTTNNSATTKHNTNTSNSVPTKKRKWHHFKHKQSITQKPHDRKPATTDKRLIHTTTRKKNNKTTDKKRYDLYDNKINRKPNIK